MKLSEMTLQELWMLFPVILRPYNSGYADWYLDMSLRLMELLSGDIARLSHIGSTAVSGLLSKPTVDILLEVRAEADVTDLKNRIIADDWIIMSEIVQPKLLLSFNKGYTESGFADRVYHLHVRAYADHDELYFRDYLIAHRDVADAYGALKLSLLEKYKNDRDGYSAAKTDFVKEYTAKARAEFPDKYKPK